MDFRSTLARMPLFANLASETLNGLASLAERKDLHSGECLYAEGAAPTHFYIVVSGRVRVTSGAAPVAYVGRQEPVGEMGLITGEPHTTAAHAVRDSLLVQIPRTGFLDFLDGHAAILLALTRLMIGRLRQDHRQRRMASTASQRTFAIIPASPGLPVTELAERLVRLLSGWPKVRLVTAAHVDAALGPGVAETPFSDREANARLMAWLDGLESRHRYLIYAATVEGDAWSLRCMRQADRVLVLAEASAPPTTLRTLGDLSQSGRLAPVELVLLRPEGEPSPHTLAWRERTGARAHYFVHPWYEPELSALARQMTGRGIGVVLGGGGARGFAHIGLIRALEQLEIPIDVTGGTSMGAFMSGLLACELDSVEIAHIARETFVTGNYLNDYHVPKVSLIRGRKFLARLRDVFGEREIEDLRRTYFCVSSNLTSGARVVHDRGPLALWLGTSMAVPGIAPPIAYEGELLCDGGLVDNMPTEFMQGLERGSIIACNVSTAGDLRTPGAGIGKPDPDALLSWKGPGHPPGLREILLRTATLSGDTILRQAAERADVYLHMPVAGIGMFDWRRLEDLIEIGYRHALAQLTPLRDTLMGLDST